MLDQDDIGTSVYNIESGTSFVDVFAQGLLEKVKFDPLALSDYLILLPSRRACRSVRDAFLRKSNGKPMLLPKLQPLGDVDADELSIFLGAQSELSHLTNIPPAISSLRRELLLARLILMFHDETMPTNRPGFDQAVGLARELGSFLDQVQTERSDFDNLKDLVPENFAEHWQITLDFLTIVTQNWPLILEEQGVIDPAQRRNLLIEAQMELWEMMPPKHPIIVAGSTGSVPVVADLMAMVAKMDMGCVVLPGLDCTIEDKGWHYIGSDHPQFYLKSLLEKIQIDRSDVKNWAVEKKDVSVNTVRVRLMSEVMRPVETTEEWQNLDIQNIDETALDGFMRIDCDTAQEEADVIALMMRQVLEQPQKTAALVTPDRKLARRVAMSLKRWNIDIDDSGGEKLSNTAIGIWLSLTGRMVIEKLSPVSFLACLKYPFASAGMVRSDFLKQLNKLETSILRGPRPDAGFAGLYDALNGLKDKEYLKKGQEICDELTPWVQNIEEKISPFLDMLSRDDLKPFTEILAAHIDMAEQLAATDSEKGDSRLWRREDGEAASNFLNELHQLAHDIPPLSGIAYLELLRGLMDNRVIRPRFGNHPRLSILGQLEARLYNADLVILGAVNEKTWPSGVGGDPWMSRQMRQEFGLPDLECQTSISAHDFVQAITSPEIVVTRSKMVDGEPTIASRWLFRLDTVLQGLGLELSDQQAQKWRGWAMTLDKAESLKPQLCSRPNPTPPVESRPQKLSVTQIETWMRDPYAIYANKILRLNALDDVDEDLGGAARGNIIHQILDDFIKEFPHSTLPDNALEKLMSLGKGIFDKEKVPIEAHAFWWPRFENMAKIFVQNEQDWRRSGHRVLETETTGKTTFPSNRGAFTLTAKADRIDLKVDGSLAIIDYKTGLSPSKIDVRTGFSPQLPLEAIIAQNGGFSGIEARDVSYLSFWIVSGGKPPFRVVDAYSEKDDLSACVKETRDGIQELINLYEQPETSYPSRPRENKAPRYSDYEHFARIKEWSVLSDGEDE